MEKKSTFFLGLAVGETFTMLLWWCWNQREDAKLSLHLSQVTQISLIGPIEGQPVIGVILEWGKHLNPVPY